MSTYQRIGVATAFGALALVVGSFAFQASSLAFDYMKLRGLPLYASASSLGEFADRLDQLVHAMDSESDTVKGLIRERATIDITVAAKDEMAQRTITAARNFLRTTLTADQVKATEFDKAGMSYSAYEVVFQKLCPREQNNQASIATAGIESSPTTPATGPVAPARPVSLNPDQVADFAQACPINNDTYCTDDTPDPKAGVRAQMICAQRALQTAQRRKGSIGTFSFDAGKYITDTLQITYPNFSREKVDDAIQVSDTYRALTERPGVRACAVCQGQAPGSSPATLNRPIAKAFWDWLMSIPLAILYLLLAFLFGMLGSLSSYFYKFASPTEASPEHTPFLPIVAGGGGSILVILIVMAGFQFLSVGSSTADLAYPNPLTVAGIAVLSGLRGDKVLTALQDLVGRVFKV